MEKTTTLNLRVNPTVKRSAEDVLARLGIPMSTAINIYLNQIALTGGIPFQVTLPKAPESINADMMSKDELYEKLLEGYEDTLNGNVIPADKAFAKLEEKFKL